MSLTPGSRIGPYEIGAQIGVGGMGEVYRATDRNLKRRVAIKVLPEAVAADAERLARFQREAEVLASLNHPHIAAIYGLERAGSATALVMELVDGPTLADRIAEGPIALDEALAIAKQIAEALEVAHEQGVIHRDLKPANIKVRPDGTVKVLDFGLAKVAESTSAAGVDVTASPTITSPAMTSVGIILGTAAYMSPEQARGKPVDKRADIWAFGCVLYEMLAGRRAFDGETISDTIAAVLDRQPNWSALPPTTPTNIHRLLERCLAKTGKGRLRDVGDARLELDEALTSGHAAPLPMLNAAPGTVRRSRSVVLIAATIVAVALGALAFTVAPTLLKSVPLDTSRYRFTPLAAEPADENSPSWSPDGRSVAYVADVDGVKQVFRRALDSALSTQITKFAADAVAPFWSPDGTRIYFASPFTLGGDLYAVGATGGDAQPVMKDAGAATIAPDGKTLVFLRGRGGRRSLYIAGIPTGDPQPYRTSPFPETFTRSDSVEFSRDGTKIGVLVEQQEGPSFRSELWVIPYPSGTPRRVLARARDSDGWPHQLAA